MRLLSSFAAGLLAVAPLIAAADCDDDSRNLIQTDNCAFDADTSGWTLIEDDPATVSSAAHVSTFGYPETGQPNSLGALQLDVSSSNSFVIVRSDACIPIDDTSTYNFGAAIESESGRPFCRVFAEIFSDASCTSPAGSASGFDRTVPSSWFVYAFQVRDFNTPPSTQGARLNIRCDASGTSAYSVLIDNAFFGPSGLLPVELQSFQIE